MVLFSGESSSKDFDITLMICLVRNLIHIDIMDNRLPSATDTSLRADLSRIKYYRNFVVHCDIKSFLPVEAKISVTKVFIMANMKNSKSRGKQEVNVR
jgi:hypothetical protein